MEQTSAAAILARSIFLVDFGAGVCDAKKKSAVVRVDSVRRGGNLPQTHSSLQPQSMQERGQASARKGASGGGVSKHPSSLFAFFEFAPLHRLRYSAPSRRQ